MSVEQQKLLAEALRSYFVEFAPLPVKGGAFALDALLPDKPSMSLQITGGPKPKTYIDGSQSSKREKFFTIFYRAKVTDDNDAKSAMMGALDGLGQWMNETPLPYLGDWLTVTRFEQIQLSNIANQENKFITYQAGFALGYTTK